MVEHGPRQRDQVGHLRANRCVALPAAIDDVPVHSGQGRRHVCHWGPVSQVRLFWAQGLLGCFPAEGIGPLAHDAGLGDDPSGSQRWVSRHSSYSFYKKIDLFDIDCLGESQRPNLSFSFESIRACQPFEGAGDWGLSWLSLDCLCRWAALDIRGETPDPEENSTERQLRLLQKGCGAFHDSWAQESSLKKLEVERERWERGHVRWWNGSTANIKMIQHDKMSRRNFWQPGEVAGVLP